MSFKPRFWFALRRTHPDGRGKPLVSCVVSYTALPAYDTRLTTRLGWRRPSFGE